MDRFWEKVEKAEGCWLWRGPQTSGYGQFAIDATRSGRRRTTAHRAAWEITKGPIPDGLCVLHHCDVPLCVNPGHLFLGTRADNMQDMAAKGRQGKKGQVMSPRLPDDVRAGIKTLCAFGATQKGIANALRVHQTTVNKIVLGKL